MSGGNRELDESGVRGRFQQSRDVYAKVRPAQSAFDRNLPDTGCAEENRVARIDQ
jgi:hypothetical protein